MLLAIGLGSQTKANQHTTAPWCQALLAGQQGPHLSAGGQSVKGAKLKKQLTMEVEGRGA